MTGRVRMRGRGETISMLLASHAYYIQAHTHPAATRSQGAPRDGNGPGHPICALIHHGCRQGGRTFLPRMPRVIARAAQSALSGRTTTRATATASHNKTQFAAVACVPGFTLGLGGGPPSTSDVHVVDNESTESITTRATTRARSTQARRG